MKRFDLNRNDLSKYCYDVSKINKEKICGEVYKLSETEKKIFGIK